MFQEGKIPITTWFLELYAAINDIVIKHSTTPDTVTARKMKNLKEIPKCLQHLEVTSKEFLGDKYVTNIIVILIVNNLRDALRKFAPKGIVDACFKMKLCSQWLQRLCLTQDPKISTLRIHWWLLNVLRRQIKQINGLERDKIFLESSGSDSVITDETKQGKLLFFYFWAFRVFIMKEASG